MPLAQMAGPRVRRRVARGHRPGQGDPLRRAPVDPPAFLPPPPALPETGHESPQTTHFSVVDAEGNAVANTYTLNFPFGSGVTVPGLGFLLNDEMDDFASKMGAPNGFGLIQGPANAVAPNKRPLSSMTPTIVSDQTARFTAGEGGAWGSRGGCGWCSARRAGRPSSPPSRTTCCPFLDNGLDVQAAADAPRFHHQYLPDILQVEKRFSRTTTEALAPLGYTIKREAEFDEKSAGEWGDSELIAVDPQTGELLGGRDRRHHFGKAAGY